MICILNRSDVKHTLRNKIKDILEIFSIHYKLVFTDARLIKEECGLDDVNVFKPLISLDLRIILIKIFDREASLTRS